MPSGGGADNGIAAGEGGTGLCWREEWARGACVCACAISGSGAVFGPGEGGARPTVFMSSGWKRPRRTEVFNLKSANFSCHSSSSSTATSE